MWSALIRPNLIGSFDALMMVTKIYTTKQISNRLILDIWLAFHYYER